MHATHAGIDHARGRRRWATLAIAAALAAATAAGCGDDEAGEAGASPSEGSAPASALTVTETDFAIAPAEAQIEKAGTVRISVSNDGEAPHALAIETADGVEQTGTLAAGESGELEASLDDGTYTWYCPIADHRARGMEGTVTVGTGEGAGGSDPGEDSGGGYSYP